MATDFKLGYFALYFKLMLLLTRSSNSLIKLKLSFFSFSILYTICLFYIICELCVKRCNLNSNCYCKKWCEWQLTLTLPFLP